MHYVLSIMHYASQNEVVFYCDAFRFSLYFQYRPPFWFYLFLSEKEINLISIKGL